MGVFDGVPFEEDSIDVMEGDRLLLYTDGLNEGINESNEEFGYDRIKETLETADGDLLGALYEKARDFAGESEQFDDITMQLFESVKLKAFTLYSPGYKDIPAVTDQINEFVKGYDGDKTAELDIIIDEMMNNYVSYAFDGVKKPRLDIEVRLFNGVAQLTFTNNGSLFDPMTIEALDIETDMTERPEGGMGIMIAKTVADKICYRAVEGKNRLTVKKDLNAE